MEFDCKTAIVVGVGAANGIGLSLIVVTVSGVMDVCGKYRRLHEDFGIGESFTFDIFVSGLRTRDVLGCKDGDECIRLTWTLLPQISD